GEAAVVVAGGQALPALVLLAGDERLGRFALGVQGVELLLQALLGALAGVDRAADQGQGGRSGRLAVAVLHAAPPLAVRWKKWKPLQCEPVMALATAERER